MTSDFDFDDDQEQGPAFARDTDPATSHAAADSISEKTVAHLEGQILQVLKERGPSNRDEIIDALQAQGHPARMQSITPRFAPLKLRGLLVDTGATRRSSHTGRYQIVWAIPDPMGIENDSPRIVAKVKRPPCRECGRRFAKRRAS